MPPALLFDLSDIDLHAKSLFTKEDILEVNPQNYEMQQLDGILWYNSDEHLILGYKDLTDDEFDIMIDISLGLVPLWENALGKDWQKTITREKLRSLYELM